MDVLPTTDNTGLPDGAPTVTAATMQTIDFTFTGSSISELGRNGTDYFDGIIANPKYYDSAGELIDSWWIDKASDTQKNYADSSNPLALQGVNWTTDLVTLVDGYYLSSNLSKGFEYFTLVSNATRVGDVITLSASATIYGDASVDTSAYYLITYTVDSITPGTSGVTAYCGSTGAGTRRIEVGTYSEVVQQAGVSQVYFYTGGGFIAGDVSNFNIRKVLNP
jgi:hypothetical protein